MSRRLAVQDEGDGAQRPIEEDKLDRRVRDSDRPPLLLLMS